MLDQAADLRRTVEAEARGLCLRYCDSVNVAENLVSTVLFRVWRSHASSETPIRNLRAYARRTAENVCWAHLGLEQRQSPLLREVLVRETPRPVEQEIADRAETFVLLRFIKSLPGDLGEFLMAFYVDRMSYVDLAIEKGLTASAVRYRVKRAKNLLLKKLTASESPEQSEGSEPAEPGTSDARASNRRRRYVRRSAASRRMAELLDRVASRLLETQVVHIPLPEGVTRDFLAVFPHTLSRREQRIASLEKYIAQHPLGWRKRFELANLLLSTNRVKEAERHYREVLRLQPRVLEAALRLGQLLTLERRTEEALPVYEESLRHVRKPAARRHLEGLICHLRGDREGAIQRFEEAIALERNNLAHYHALAAAYDPQVDPVRTLRAYDRALEVDPDDVYSLTHSHDALLILDRLKELDARLERAVRLDPNYTLAVKLLANRRAQMGKVRGREGQKTLAMLRRVLSRDPDSADATDALATYYRRLGDFYKASALIEGFLNPYAWSFQTTPYLQCLHHEGAVALHRHARALNPEWPDVYYRGISCFFELGLLWACREWIEEAARRFPAHGNLLVFAGGCLTRMDGHRDRGMALLKQGLRQGLQVSCVWLQYAEALDRIGRRRAALRALDRAEDLLPPEAALQGFGVMLVRGRVLRKLGREEDARECFRRAEAMALQESVRHVRGYAIQGMALMELGDLKRARECFQKAMAYGVMFVRPYDERVVQMLEEEQGKACGTDT